MAAKETVTTRVTRLEELHSVLAEKITILVEAQIKTEKQLATMGKETDERIGRLVVAIGELITQMQNGKKK